MVASLSVCLARHQDTARRAGVTFGAAVTARALNGVSRDLNAGG